MKNFDVQNLNDWLEKIEKKHPAMINLGLERVRQVWKNNFHCPVVTIAGTNGKGSTLTTLAKLMEKSNKKIGTYTSPHLLHFNERIRINGRSVSEQMLCEAFEVVESLAKGIDLTYFEFTTLAAFVIFQKAECDLLILEIGMGGRLDAVNVVDPDLAIITALSLDHEEWLGSSLDAIAKEKAGILRPEIPVILSHEATNPVILEQVKSGQNKVYIEKEHFDYVADQWENKLENLFINIPTNYLPSNSVSLAMAAYTVLRDQFLDLPPLETAVQSLEGVGMIGRFHCINSNGKNFIFDVAHNPGGTAWLANRLKARKKTGRTLAVWSSLADKAHAAIIQPLKAVIDRWLVCSVEGTPRAMAVEALAEILKEQGIHAVTSFTSVEAAMAFASEQANPDDEIIVLGSFFTVGQAYSVIKQDLMMLTNFGLYHA